MIYIYFDNKTNIGSDSVSIEVVSYIDKSDVVSDSICKSRRAGTIFHKNSLSTGCKTILNILSHPDVCFNLIECGNNALQMLCKLDNGTVYWEYPFIVGYADRDVEIVLNNSKKFSNWTEFMTYCSENLSYRDACLEVPNV